MGNHPETMQEMWQELQAIKTLLNRLCQQTSRPGSGQQQMLWTVQQVADYLHKSKGTIQSHYQARKDFPPSRKIGNKRYWKAAEIMAWANRRTIH